MLFRSDLIEEIDGIVNIIMDVVMTTKSSVRISGEDKPTQIVKAKFLKLNKENMDYVLYCLQHNTTVIKNMVLYIQTALYNAPNTESLYYRNMVNHDMYGTRDGP